MSAYARRLAAVLTLLFLLAGGLDFAHGASSRTQRARNQQRSAAARARALKTAISAAKTRVQRAEAVASAASGVYFKRQSEAGESSGRFHTALRDMEQADNDKFGASQELAELRAKIEKFSPEDAPIKKARAEYDAAVEALAEIRSDIYQSDKYHLLYEAAMKSANKAEELERVTEVCFEEDPDYRQAKQRVEHAKSEYNQIRYKLYEVDPDWAPAVERAKAATIAQNKAATGVKASGAESGIERINLRDAGKRLATAQAKVADAQSDLKRLEKQQKSQTKTKATTSSAAKKNK
jgi:chromosome segregation ATPase